MNAGRGAADRGRVREIARVQQLRTGSERYRLVQGQVLGVQVLFFEKDAGKVQKLWIHGVGIAAWSWIYLSELFMELELDSGVISAR